MSAAYHANDIRQCLAAIEEAVRDGGAEALRAAIADAECVAQALDDWAQELEGGSA